MKTRARLLALGAAALAVLAAACGGDGGGGGGDLGLSSPGTLTVGSDIAFEPFEFIQDGQPAGFDIDLLNEIAERLELQTEFVNASFDTIFTQLAGGDFDAIASAITITDERKQTIDFSDPYFAANQALAVLDGSDVSGVADLSGKQLAVQAGTTGLDYAKENFEANGATIVEFPTSEAAFTALESGQVDAVFIDLPVVGARAASSPNVKMAEEVDTGELYGIGVQKGNEALLAAINEQLAEIISDGTYAEIYGRWFEGDIPAQFAG